MKSIQNSIAMVPAARVMNMPVATPGLHCRTNTQIAEDAGNGVTRRSQHATSFQLVKLITRVMFIYAPITTTHEPPLTWGTLSPHAQEIGVSGL